MPTSVASQPRYRERRQAIGRKAWLEAELLMNSEDGLIMSAKNQVAPTPSSPTSVSSSLTEFMPEVQPIALPTAWTVVGKGGRPLKNVKMYDEPAKPVKKKRLRARKSKAGDEEEELLLLERLEEMNSSSKCVRQLDLATLKHEKQKMQGLDARKWAHYRQAKKLKLAMHLAALMILTEQEGQTVTAVDAPLCAPSVDEQGRLAKQRQNANSHAVKTRRKARQAHAAERCYWPEADDEAMPALPTEHPQTKVKQAGVMVAA